MNKLIIITIIAFTALACASPPQSVTPQRLTSTQDQAPSNDSTPCKSKYQTCADGSKLTMTGCDANQTNYKCESGAVGAYTN